MNRIEKKMQVQLLVYTRSNQFDYGWVYGHSDTKLQRDLEQLFQTSIGNTLLNREKREVKFFFQLNGYYVLLIADASDRVDKQKRIIFDRAMFVWQSGNIANSGLTHRDLHELDKILAEEARKVYDNLAENEPFIKPKLNSLLITLPAAEQSPEEVVFTDGYKWKDVWQRNLIVEFPSSYSFGMILELIGRQPLEETVAVCHGLSKESRYPKDKSCAVGGGNQNGTEILIYDRGFEFRASGKIQKAININIQSTQGSAGFSPTKYETHFDDFQVVGEFASNASFHETTKPPQGFVASEEDVELNELLDKLAEKINSQPQQRVNVVNQVWARFSNNKNKQISKLITEIIYLLTPANAFVPLEIHVLWQHLFIEVLLLPEALFEDFNSDWSRRTQHLKSVTLAKTSNQQYSRWQETFKEKCDQLADSFSNSATIGKDNSLKITR
jgi:hypothetical protein